MATKHNRQARRHMSKVKKEPWDLKLLDWSGASATAGVYYDIMNTSWRGAGNCAYEYHTGMTWLHLLYGSKFYFAPVAEKFRCKVRTVWANDTVMLFTLQGKGLLVNVTYKREDTQTVTLFFPNCIMDLSDPPAIVQTKSSTFYQTVKRNIHHMRAECGKQEREDVYAMHVSSGMTPEWARMMCGLVSDDVMEWNLCTLILGDLLTELLQVFRTLAFIDYAEQLGHSMMLGGNMIALSPNAVAVIEAKCASVSSAVSSLKLIYSDEDGACGKEIIGNTAEFFNAHTPPVPKRAIEWLRDCCKEEVLDLDAITEKSRTNFFYIDRMGNPIDMIGVSERRAAGWMCAATGLTYSYSDHQVFGLYTQAEDHWEFQRFTTLLEVYRGFEREERKGLSMKKWQPLLSSKFILRGRGLRSSLPDDRDALEDVTFYTCSPDMLDILPDYSNIKTLDQMNFFIDGFIRMLRRRKVDSGLYACYNTGLVGKNGRYIHLLIPNIAGPKNDIQPDLVDITMFDTFTSEPQRPYKYVKQLYLPAEEIVTLDEKALLHVVSARDYRIPEELSEYNKAELMEWVGDSLRYGMSMLNANPFFAQPCYSVQMDTVCHLLPLYTEHVYDASHLAGALFIRNRRVATLYSISMARDHACLFTVPKAVWLPD